MNRDAFLAMFRDPRWQKKRLEIMERDCFACAECGDETNNLQVHHICYEKDSKPWEYDDMSLITLCDSCHQEEHNERMNYYTMLTKELAFAGATRGVIQGIAVDIYEARKKGYDARTISLAISFALRNEKYMSDCKERCES